MRRDFVITISSTDEEHPVHIILPTDEEGMIVRSEIYVLIPVGVDVPGRYTVILEQALEALEVAVRFMIEGKKPKRKGPSNWASPGPSLN